MDLLKNTISPITCPNEEAKKLQGKNGMAY